MLQMELDSFPWNQQLKDKQILVYSTKLTLLHGAEIEQTNVCYPRSFAAFALEAKAVGKKEHGYHCWGPSYAQQPYVIVNVLIWPIASFNGVAVTR